MPGYENNPCKPSERKLQHPALRAITTDQEHRARVRRHLDLGAVQGCEASEPAQDLCQNMSSPKAIAGGGKIQPSELTSERGAATELTTEAASSSSSEKTPPSARRTLPGQERGELKPEPGVDAADGHHATFAAGRPASQPAGPVGTCSSPPPGNGGKTTRSRTLERLPQRGAARDPPGGVSLPSSVGRTSSPAGVAWPGRGFGDLEAPSCAVTAGDLHAVPAGRPPRAWPPPPSGSGGKEVSSSTAARPPSTLLSRRSFCFLLGDLSHSVADGAPSGAAARGPVATRYTSALSTGPPRSMAARGASLASPRFPAPFWTSPSCCPLVLPEGATRAPALSSGLA